MGRLIWVNKIVIVGANEQYHGRIYDGVIPHSCDIKEVPNLLKSYNKLRNNIEKMCKPFNGKMKEFKWRPGIFQKRLAQLTRLLQYYEVVHDERFQRTFIRLMLFADLEIFDIQPPCYWSYNLVPDEIKIELMNRECPCGINTDEIHYMDMSEIEFNDEGRIVFTSDHDVDFGFGGLHEIEMWTFSEQKQIHELVEQMKDSNENEKVSIKAKIVKFIADTMAVYEQEVLAFQCSMILEAQLSASIKESIVESIEDSIAPQNNENRDCIICSGIELLISVCFYLLLLLISGIVYAISGIASSLVLIWHQEPLASKTSKPKKISRRQRVQADAIQAAKDIEEAKLKQLENKKHENIRSIDKKPKKSAKTHFRKSQKPARL